jgi:Zn-dependent protease with chaperone function
MQSRLTPWLSSLPVLALYAATVLLETPVILVRWLLTLAGAALILLVLHHSIAGAAGYGPLALIPTAWSILALITPFGGGWWWKQNLGGREPSGREQIAYQDAIHHLRHRTPLLLREPSSWFVLDDPQLDAAVCGDTLMLSRGLLESGHLVAVLAHELGHLASTDGKLTAALNRLVIHAPPKPAEREPAKSSTVIVTDDRALLTVTFLGSLLWMLRKTIVFAKGGLGLRLTAPFWGVHWREREYTADRFAAGLGQADELADFLEIHALTHDHPVPFVWLTEHTHPPTELRIDKLRNAPISGTPPAGSPANEPLPGPSSPRTLPV